MPPKAGRTGGTREKSGGAAPGAAGREAPLEDFNIGAKIKGLRLLRKKTLQEVADETGFSPALISQVENNNVSPPLATLSKIAKVLGVRVGYFFREEGPEEAYEVMRREERPAVTRVISRTGGQHGYTYNALTHRKRDKIMEPFLLFVDPGMRDEENLYSHEGEECVYLMEGRAEFRTSEGSWTMEEGDCLYFDSDIPHAFRSLGKEPAQAFVIVYTGEQG